MIETKASNPMASADYSDEQLANYFEETLDPVLMAAIEKDARQSPELLDRLEKIRQWIDGGEHSIGAIWARERLSCPTRDDLAAYQHEILPQGHQDYVRFHLEVIKCPYCVAIFEDQQSQTAAQIQSQTQQQQRILENSHHMLEQLRRK